MPHPVPLPANAAYLNESWKGWTIHRPGLTSQYLGCLDPMERAGISLPVLNIRTLRQLHRSSGESGTEDCYLWSTYCVPRTS